LFGKLGPKRILWASIELAVILAIFSPARQNLAGRCAQLASRSEEQLREQILELLFVELLLSLGGRAVLEKHDQEN
jgi:hypothetical protein